MRSAAALAVEGRLYAALGVLRVVLLLNACVLNWLRRDNFAHPHLGVLAVAVMAGWTAYAGWAYRVPRRRTSWLLAADLAVAVGLLLVSVYVKGEGLRATIPGFWVTGALLAWSVHWRWRGGLVAGALVCLADVAVRQQLTSANYGYLFLLMVLGPIVGYVVGSLVEMATDRDEAQAAAAAAAERAATAAERARLARAVHDGVLQVLALVQRRGDDLGPDGARLARLAGEQEVALRSLIHAQDAAAPPVGDDLDLSPLLERIGAGRRLVVEVATPGGPVVLPRSVGVELVAAVGACLDNVATHVGEDARAWVLLEDLGSSVAVSVRDEGPGIAVGRLAQAARDGRLGVTSSIQGRLADLGGEASLGTGPGGTEWELTVPRS